MRHIKIIHKGKNLQTVERGGCGSCQASCQSACKTSCTVANQTCRNQK